MRRSTPEVQYKEGYTYGLKVNNFFSLQETCPEPGNPASQRSKVLQLVGWWEVLCLSGRQQLMLSSELNLSQELTATASHKCLCKGAVAPGPAAAQQHSWLPWAIPGVPHHQSVF